MWIFTSKGFLSIVRPSAFDPAVDAEHKRSGFTPGRIAETHLLVRARRAGHIESHFPDATVLRSPHRDYRYRALVHRAAVAEAVADYVASFRYTNFKDSVADHDLRKACGRVWSVMHTYQTEEPLNDGGPYRLDVDIGYDEIKRSVPGFSPAIKRSRSTSGIVSAGPFTRGKPRPKPVLPGNSKKGRR